MASVQRRQANELEKYEFIGLDVSQATLHVSRRPPEGQSAKQLSLTIQRVFFLC